MSNIKSRSPVCVSFLSVWSVSTMLCLTVHVTLSTFITSCMFISFRSTLLYDFLCHQSWDNKMATNHFAFISWSFFPLCSCVCFSLFIWKLVCFRTPMMLQTSLSLHCSLFYTFSWCDSNLKGQQPQILTH